MNKTFAEVADNIPDLDFTDSITPESIISDMIEDYNEEMSNALGIDYSMSQADPMRAIISSSADVLAQLVYLIDRNAKMNFLKYAEGEYLDNLGLLKSVERKDATPATTTLQFSCEENPESDIVIPVGTEVAGADDVYFATDSEVTIPAAERATTTVTFTLSAAQDAEVVIPAGTKLTNADESVTFDTTEACTIAAGETTGSVVAEAEVLGAEMNDIEDGAFTVMDPAVTAVSTISNTTSEGGADSVRVATVSATCETAGELGNDFLVGELNEMIDDIEGIDTVMNTTITGGGTDTEDDEDLRERIYDAPILYATTGPTNTYELRAKSVSDDICDAKVTSPNPGDVNVYIMTYDAELPSDELLEEVNTSLSADDVRPLTDSVTVLAPDVVNYDIELTYHIASNDKNAAETISADVEDAVEEFQAWEAEKIGRPIDPSELIALLRDTGAVQCTVTKPEITNIPDTSIAIADNVTITNGGYVNG